MIKGKLLVPLVLVLVALGIFAYFLIQYLGLFSTPETQKTFDQALVDEKSKIEASEVDFEVIEVAKDLFVPWSIVFTPQNSLLVAQRNGAILEINESTGDKKEIYRFDDISQTGETGLMGLTTHPDYENNGYLYACYAYPDQNAGIKDRVVRLVYKDSGANFDRIILDDIPAARFHAGCRIKFGPDEKLYVTTGDATDADIAQDKNSLGGKILRLNDDGSIPQDNPFDNSYIYSLGHRNSQGIDWDSEGRMYSSEHGPSGFDGPGGGDELNLIVVGKNYGWPIVSHDESQVGLEDPLVVWTPAIAPASLIVYKSQTFPQFAGDIFIGGLRGEGVYRVIIKDTKVGKWERLVTGYGRIRDVATSADGQIYFSTSNQDGRGKTYEGDDKIYKLAPVRESAYFEIFTNGVRRDFSDSKYHYSLKSAYIEPQDPNRIVLQSQTSWSDFFDSLPEPMRLTADCLYTGSGQSFCTTENKSLMFYLNDRQVDASFLEDTIKNGDRLTVLYE